VAANKKSGTGFASFETLYEYYYAQNTVDMIEFAMWWTTCEDEHTYGAFGADGIFLPREDLGGVAALRAGVAKIHKMGRRVQLYVSADIVHLNSSFFNASWPWERWADWPTSVGPSDPAENHNASTLCHAFNGWQLRIASFTARIIALTGVDGVRLDGLGGSAKPCSNPSHHHSSSLANQGTAANVQIAKLTREAMDGVEGGADAVLSSEGYQDVFHPHTQMSLTMWYPGREIDAMRVALPEYRAAAYSPDAGDIETALNGWMSAGSGHALRKTWPYASKCGALPLSGFPSPPCNYPLDGGRRTRWAELRPTLVSAILPGQLSDFDPLAPHDPECNCRLYITPTYSVLLAARWNGSSPTAASTTITLPQATEGDRQALSGVTHAVEIDAYTLAVNASAVEPASHSVQLTGSGFSAVLLPKPDCDALVVVTPLTIPAIDATGANSTTISLSVLAPWQQRRASPNSNTFTVNITAPGLKLSASTITLPGSLTLTAAVSAFNLKHMPVYYFMLTIEGDGVLPTRRWLKAVQQQSAAI
jgi:hypothetical protein